MKDYYSLLDVNRNATKADIKSSYRRLAVKYHPDKSSDPDSASRFIAVTEAYDVLSNKKRRAQYAKSKSCCCSERKAFIL